MIDTEFMRNIMAEMTGHDLHTPADFTNEETETSSLAKVVVSGGLGICKRCGAGEADLDDYPTCADYESREHEGAEG